MPKQLLTYVSEAYKERQVLFQGLGENRDFDRVLAKEHEFVKLCIELSSNKAFLQDLPKLIDEVFEATDYELMTIAGYIALLSESEVIINQCKIDTQSVSLLKSNKHEYFLDNAVKKKTIHFKKFFIRDNNYTKYTQYIEAWVNKLDKARDKYYYYGVLASMHQEHLYPDFVKALNAEKDEDEKDSLALDLLPAPIPEVWQHFQEFMKTGKEMNGDELSTYGAPSDLIYFEEGAKKLWKNEYALEDIGIGLRWLGYAGGFKWYVKLLEHPKAKVRESFHFLMMSFFKPDDKEMEEGWDLRDPNINYDKYDYPEDAPFVSTDVLLEFWESKRKYTGKVLDPNIRYWHGEPFDFIKVAEMIEKSPTIGDMRGIVDHFRIWTGKNFVFDSDALIETWVEQYQDMKKWLEDNKEKFPPGKWYRWGKEVT